MKKITNVWPEPYGDMTTRQLMTEARELYRLNQLPTTLDRWEEEKKSLRQQLWTSLGTEVDDSIEPDLQIHGETQMDGYSVQNITYQSRKDFYVTADLYIPQGDGLFPAVIGLHGHWLQGRIAQRVQSRGHTLAKNGYVCLSVDSFGSGERCTVHGEFEYHGDNIGASLMNVGETLMGMQVVDNMRGVSLLQSLDYVDSEKIGATGASGGGNQTMWLAALDDRVVAAMPVVSVGTFESYIGAENCICECLPTGLTFTEESAILALAAPRALKICNATGESNISFFPEEMLRSFKQAKSIFRLYGKGDKLNNEIFRCSHGYWPIIREAMLGWFDKWLKGIGDGSAREEVPFETIEEEKLMCFEKGQRPDSIQSIADFCYQRGTELKKVIKQSPLDLQQKKIELSELLHIDDSREIVKSITAHGRKHIRETQYETFTLRTVQGSLYPILVKHPESGSCYSIVIATEGKDQAFHDAEFSKIYNNGNGLIFVDLWATGETMPTLDSESKNPHFSSHHNTARFCLWLSKPMLGIWANNLKLIADFAKKTLGANKLSLYASGDAALSGIFSQVVFDIFEHIEIYNAPISYLQGKEKTTCSMAIHVPGIINWGDIEQALTMCDCKVVLTKPVTLDEKDYTT